MKDTDPDPKPIENRICIRKKSFRNHNTATEAILTEAANN